MNLNPIAITRLEKAARDNGYDLKGTNDSDWLQFFSSHTSLRVWLTENDPDNYVAAFSDSNIKNGLSLFASPVDVPLPPNAAIAFSSENLNHLYQILKRAFQLSRSLPDSPLVVFQEKTKNLPEVTEVDRLVKQRIGQDIFRDSLLEYWDGKCALTGLSIKTLLRASHIKPWASCTENHERLSVYNGILLSPNFDAAFDSGLISFQDDGELIVSNQLSDVDQELLGFKFGARILGFEAGHKPFLQWHRDQLFKK